MTEERPDLQPGQLRWPLLSIDFEASALGRGSYPVEIGMALWRGPAAAVEVWSSLVSPTEDWMRKGLRMDTSDAIHGIDRKLILAAPNAASALSRANAFAGVGAIAFCDGGGHDAYWLTRLQEAAGFAATFEMGRMAMLRGTLSEGQRDRFDGFRPDQEVAHRAGPDARDHWLGMAFALGLPDPEVVLRSDPTTPS